MSKMKLNAIAAQALLDNEFKSGLLNGKRREKLNTFGLNDEEIQAVMSIEAMDLDQFIRRLGNLISPSPALS